MLHKVRRTIQRFGMLNPGDHVIVAVSGGADSVALLQALTLLSPEYKLNLTVAHLNHGLRGDESDAEEKLVRQLSEDRGIPFSSRRVDLRTLKKGRQRRHSLEEIGRQERYEFFTSLAAEVGATRIALGHHREDQAETVLMNLIRGSGLEGLKGIPPVRDGRLIRPLFEVGRTEILAFLEAEGIPWLEDGSNRQDFYLRNRIRHQLLPLLKEYNPQIVSSLERMSRIARREDACLQDAAGKILAGWKIHPAIPEGGMTLPIPDFLELPEAIQYRVLKILLTRLVPHPFRVAAAHVEAVRGLIRGTGSSNLACLPGRVLVKGEAGRLTFFPAGRDSGSGRQLLPPGRRVNPFSHPLEIPGLIEIMELGRVVKTAFVDRREIENCEEGKKAAFFDLEKISPPLVIRNRREGDRFQPLGMAGTKKLKAYFIDEKIPQDQRDLIPLLADNHSVLWVAGLRLSERVRIGEKTRRIVKIEII